MNIINDQKKCMASLAVFKQLFNSGNDIFCIIAEFIKQEIISRGLTDFTEQQMHEFLLIDNGFDVPQAVIHTSIKRLPFLTRQKESVVVSTSLSSDECNTFKKQIDNATEERELISKRLINYANSKREVALTNEEETELCKSFYAYVVDDTAPIRFSELVCAFILENENDIELQKHLNLIREGVISFIGLSYYNNSYGTVDSFDKEIYIYLETEILFHMAGYNGLTYQNLFEEFYSQIQEINKMHQIKNGKKVIFLRYFTETLNEINEYFDQAEKIVRRSKLPDPSKTAMHSLVNGVTDPSVIMDKRTEFDRLLKEHGIQYEDYSFDLSKDNGSYCLDYKSFIDDKESSVQEKVYSDLTLLNWIYIKRNKRKIESFANMKAILLTGNYHVMQLAMDERLHQPGELALSATIDFLTTRFWFSLCKGLSKDCNLLSANVLTKARLALASLNCESINKAYKEIEQEIDKGGYDKELMKSRIASLHRRFRMPENVDDLTEKSNLAFFTDCRSDILLAEEAAKDAAHKHEVNILMQSIEEKDKTIESQTDMFLRVLKDRLQEINEKEKDQFLKDQSEYDLSKTDWINKQMNKIRNRNIVIIAIFMFIIVAIIIVPLIIPCIPNKYSWIGILLPALLSCINRISALKNTAISKAIDYCFLSTRNNIRLELENKYYEQYQKPVLKLTTLEELEKQYKRGNKNE